MHQFIPEQAVRWDAWQSANAVSARRSDGIARLFGFTMLAATLGRAVAITPVLHFFKSTREAVSRASHSSKENSMSAPRWRWPVIGVWFALTLMAFIAIDGMAARSRLLLLVFGFGPTAMLLWPWNEDQPLLIGSLHRRQERL